MASEPEPERRLWTILNRFAGACDDDAELRSLKMAALIVAGSSCIAGGVWCVLYLALFGWGVIAALPLSFVVIVGGALWVSHHRKTYLPAVYAQIICIIWITSFIQWRIGGIFDSGLVIVWAFLGPIVGLVFFAPRRAFLMFAVFILNLAITVGFDSELAAAGEQIERPTQLIFTLMNVGVAGFVVLLFASYFTNQAVAERERANNLLFNMLPRKIARALKRESRVIAERYEHSSVLFADMVGSTPLFADLEPEAAVDWLNEVFSLFDELTEKHGLEKIRTIGDNYMVVSGVTEPREDHAAALVRLALEMRDRLAELPARDGKKMRFRFGINSGPLVGGVIGTKKFHFDVWGDSVNVASRMESHGEVGRVHISQATRELLGAEFSFQARGGIEVKGRGAMQTFFVERSEPVLQGTP